jgi:hypothetical protein
MVISEVKIKYQTLRFHLISCSVLLLLIVSTDLSGQSIESVEELVRLNQTLPTEKVFLHIDRPNYMQGDTIWFKAYSWYGDNQIPDTISRVIYIDLLNPKGRVALKRKLLIINGTSQGDFILDTTIIPGKYTIRAYTRWMQNLNTGEPFYQGVTISPSSQNFQVECNPLIIKQAGNDSLQISFRFFEMDQAGDLKNSIRHKVNYSLKVGGQLLQEGEIQISNTKQQVVKYRLSDIGKNDSVAIFGLSIRDDRLTFEKQFRIPLQERIDLQFFPEGGSMVNGMESKVAFKAIGLDGLGLDVKGVIKDNDEKDIIPFESFHRGMGSFILKPEAQKRYFAHLLYNNHQFIIPLPIALERGCIMSVNIDKSSDKLSLTIKHSHTEINTKKYVVGSASGKIRFIIPVITTEDSCIFQIPANLFPEGICRITILDSNFKPEGERLLFVDKNQRFKIKIETDSTSYGTRSKVTLSIKTTGLNGVPVQSDLSLAVVDKEQIIKDKDFLGISSYKLLQSELRGNIEDADFYFKDDSCTNLAALDLLMLTQGYRKFASGNTLSGELKFQPERNFDISGRIKFSGSKSREKKFNYHEIGLTLLCRSEGMYLDQSSPDSLGYFRFNIPLQYGKINSLLQATTTKGKPFYSEISIDDAAPLPNFLLPATNVNNLTIPAIEYVRRLQTIKKTEISKNPIYGAMSVTLDEVVVKAKAKNWYRNFEKEAEKIVDLDSLDPKGTRYRSINDLLVEQFGAKNYFNPHTGLRTIKLPSYSMSRIYSFSWFPIYVINGKKYFNGGEDHGREDGQMFLTLLNTLSTLNVNEIKRLMVLAPGNIAAYYASDSLKTYVHQSLVVIETYSDNSFRGDPLGVKTFILEGLDAPRTFYSPRYVGPERKSPLYDGRATLLWEPCIRTDNSGQAKVDFYTSDRKTDLEVIINGIEVGSGNPGHAKLKHNSNLIK